ncbi:hypothetical protein BH18CHL2_BH18CHL2_10090 [soil metagenome]
MAQALAVPCPELVQRPPRHAPDLHSGARHADRPCQLIARGFLVTPERHRDEFSVEAVPPRRADERARVTRAGERPPQYRERAAPSQSAAGVEDRERGSDAMPLEVAMSRLVGREVGRRELRVRRPAADAQAGDAEPSPRPFFVGRSGHAREPERGEPLRPAPHNALVRSGSHELVHRVAIGPDGHGQEFRRPGYHVRGTEEPARAAQVTSNAKRRPEHLREVPRAPQP